MPKTYGITQKTSFRRKTQQDVLWDNTENEKMGCRRKVTGRVIILQQYKLSCVADAALNATKQQKKKGNPRSEGNKAALLNHHMCHGARREAKKS
eukprot:1146498-Pelagomonas_calceolata.AAC.2